MPKDAILHIPVRCRVVRSSCLLLLTMALAVVTGCGDPAAVVYIDNGGSASMIVKVDGQPAANIPPGEFGMLRLASGEHEFQIKSGGKSVYKGTKTIQEPKGFATPRSYVFNPGGEHRYAACKVVYGSQLFSDATELAIVKMAEHHVGQKVDPVRREFVKIKRFAEPMPANSWFELPGGIFYVLKDAPEAVYSRSGSESRRVLTRISRKSHAQLWRCHAIENPKKRDLETLGDATVSALDSMMDLEPTE